MDVAARLQLLDRDAGGTLITNLLNAGWEALAAALAPPAPPGPRASAAGLADAEGLVARALAEGTVVVTYGDVPLLTPETLERLVAAHEADGNAVTVLTAALEDATGYGRIVRDGEEVRLGNIMLTAMATPGHTAGALSWRWVSCDGGVCRTIVYADSLSPISRDDYKFSAHPQYLAAYRAAIAKIAASPCEILVTPHPSASAMKERFALGEPLLDANACKTFAADRTKALDERLAKEAAGK